MSIRILTVLFICAINPVSAQDEPTLFIAVGDSITSGYPDIENANGCHACGGYTPYLENLLDNNSIPSTVRNYGIAGDRAQWATTTSYRGSNQIPRALAAHDPDYMLYHYGTNDLWHHSPPTVVNYIKIGIEAIIDGHATPIVGTLLPDARSNNNSVKEIPEANRLLKNLLEEMSVQVADHYYAPSASDPVDAWEDLLYDDLHPNSAGKHLMAEVWYDSILLAIEKHKRSTVIPPILLLLLDE